MTSNSPQVSATQRDAQSTISNVVSNGKTAVPQCNVAGTLYQHDTPCMQIKIMPRGFLWASLFACTAHLSPFLAGLSFPTCNRSGLDNNGRAGIVIRSTHGVCYTCNGAQWLWELLIVCTRNNCRAPRWVRPKVCTPEGFHGQALNLFSNKNILFCMQKMLRYGLCWIPKRSNSTSKEATTEGTYWHALTICSWCMKSATEIIFSRT